MVRRPFLLLAVLLAGCGSSQTAAPTEPEPPAPTTDTTPPATTSIVVYFLRGETLAPVHRVVPQTAAVGTAAVTALLDGPTATESDFDVSSTVPEGTRLLGLDVADGTATVDLSREFESGGGSLSMTARLAELVFTLTQFSTVERVQLELDGEPVSVFGGEGIVIDEPLTREDFADLTPIILVERPALGETVSSPVQVRGTASVFEATLHVRLVGPGGEEIRDEVLTASEGAPGRGTFSVEIPFSASGPGTVEAYTLSAADGSEQHNVQVPVTLAP
ncbi:MAG: Gmad2 immunoglobulin-like domain-containing protein [Gaiellaceae bacterium]